MKASARVLVVLFGVAVVVACAGCSSSRSETWIGKNVGVTTDSNAEPAR